MGQELECDLFVDGAKQRGKALLETSELLFRGDPRWKIPFASILKLSAASGRLTLRTKDHEFVFVLGPKAQVWRDNIANPKSLLEKLGVKPGDSVSLLGSFEPAFLDDLNLRKASVVRGKSPAAWLFLRADSPSDLPKMKLAAASLSGAAALWIVYPKAQKSIAKSPATKSSISESDVRSAGLKAGLTDVKVVSFSPTHTALKFVIPKSKR